MKFKIAAMAIGLACAGAVHANSPNIVFNGSNYVSVSAPTYYYWADLGSHGAPEFYSQTVEQASNVTFVHTLDFRITEPLVAAGHLNNNSVYLLSLAYANILGLEATIFRADNSFYSDFGGSGTVLTLNETSFGIGSYYLQVAGTASGWNGGGYTISVATAPVPEPETWAMLLAGMGLVAQRVRQKAKAALA